MNHSPELNELFAALSAAQAELPKVTKDRTAVYGKYADLASITEAVKSALPKHGLSWSQWVGHDDAGHDLLWTMLGHRSGQWIASAMLLRLTKNDPQAQGSAITYGRRYALCSAVGLVADDDDDGKAAQKAHERQQRRQESQRRTPTPSSHDAPPDAPRENPYAKAVHTLATQLGINDADLARIILGVTGDPSANSVNRDNREAVIEAVKRFNEESAPF